MRIIDLNVNGAECFDNIDRVLHREAFKQLDLTCSPLITRETDILDLEVLEALQSATLGLLQERRVAIETLPSSNVRISIHQSYNEHHAVGWLGYGRSFGLTSVAIGSDDPGIFATSLRGEYAHLLRALDANGAGHDTIEILESINKTSKRFRF
ncbi:hypothetical protein AB1E22_15240 [Buttiauxella gaviniae]|uniref:Adenosine deaminase domain-containing protein n=1 Tax=Buttiauxella gaviniae TaxID=82990 RepID=A0ABV3NX43_9ENTR